MKFTQSISSFLAVAALAWGTSAIAQAGPPLAAPNSNADSDSSFPRIDNSVVNFLTDGTVGATVNGATSVSYTVGIGTDCTPVTAAAPAGLEFIAWSGDYTSEAATITVTNVTADMTIVANFGRKMACGTTLDIAAEQVFDPAEDFTVKPKIHAEVENPVTAKLQKATAKVLTKVGTSDPQGTVTCEWTKKVRLYDLKTFNLAEKGGVDAEAWLDIADNQAPLDIDLMITTKQQGVTAKPLFTAWLQPPRISDIVAGDPDAHGNPTLTITGQWFGTKKPKVWREYSVPGKTEGSVVVKHQTMKVLKPDDVTLLDSKGKLAYMDATTGESKVKVVVPAKPPKGEPARVLVLENGVGMATATDPSVGAGWAIGFATGDDSAVILGTTNGGLTWVEQGDRTAWTGHPGNDISAVDASTAWAALGPFDEAGGIILHTTDGGKTWLSQDLPAAIPQGVKGIKGISRDEAWAVGLNGPVLHTVDGGQTWVVVPTTGVTILQVNRMDVLGNDIWIADVGNGADGMIHSPDAGATWRKESLPGVDPGHGPMTATIIDANTAWTTVNQQGDVYRTTDGGLNWYIDAPNASGPNDIDDLCAIAADRTWAVQNISGMSAGHVMFITITGIGYEKQSWNFPDYVYEGVTAFDDRNAWVVGFKTVGAALDLPTGSILHSVNGGVTWMSQTLPTADVSLWKISFVGAGR